MSPEKGLLKKWPEGGPRLVWKYSPCGEGYSGVSIAEGKIFTAGDFDDAEMILALDMHGKLLWKAPNGEAWQKASPGSRTTPTYNDGVLYQMNPAGRLAAYEARSGKQLWAVDLQAGFDAQYGIWGLAENVIVEGDKVLCMPGGPKGRVVALDKRTGKTVWANTQIEHAAAYCSPLVVTYGGAAAVDHADAEVGGRRGRADRQAPVVRPLRPQIAAERADAGLPRRIRVCRLRPLLGRHRVEDRHGVAHRPAGVVSRGPGQLPRRRDPPRREALWLRMPAGRQELLLRRLPHRRNQEARQDAGQSRHHLRRRDDLLPQPPGHDVALGSHPAGIRHRQPVPS